MSVKRREILTRWAATFGVDTALFEDEAEWELLEAHAAFHCALRREMEVQRVG